MCARCAGSAALESENKHMLDTVTDHLSRLVQHKVCVSLQRRDLRAHGLCGVLLNAPGPNRQPRASHARVRTYYSFRLPVSLPLDFRLPSCFSAMGFDHHAGVCAAPFRPAAPFKSASASKSAPFIFMLHEFLLHAFFLQGPPAALAA